MVVPLGRNHPPLEVLLQQGAQNDWMPAPDTIDPPSSDTMLALEATPQGPSPSGTVCLRPLAHWLADLRRPPPYF